jgi:hypothetical protein
VNAWIYFPLYRGITMSKIIYATTKNSGPKWSPDSNIFVTADLNLGPLSVWQGHNFGASYAWALLGPDLAMPGAQSNNIPTVTDYPWGPTGAFAGGPSPATFSTDNTYSWKRGHLINSRWHGPGNNWANLTPLTSIANSNHQSVEAYIDRYLEGSRLYEQAANRNHWYGVFYAVQCSTTPFADVPALNKLYSYAPEFIKISWRAICVPKLVNLALPVVMLNPLLAGGLSSVPALPFPFPVPPAIPGWPLAVLPASNIAGGAVAGAGAFVIPPIQANGFDGEIEIHQDK